MEDKAGIRFRSMKNAPKSAVIITAVFLLFLTALWPMDLFSHGYFCDDELEAGHIVANTTGYVDLAEKVYTFTFSPENNRFRGFEIYLMNEQMSDTGILLFNIYDDTGQLVDSVEIGLDVIRTNMWYKVYVDGKLRTGKEYTAEISAKDCPVYPQLPLVDERILPDESISGNVLIGYAYAHSVFPADERALISLFALAVWGILMGLVIKNDEWTEIKRLSIFLFFTVALTWNYMYNSMDVQNTSFESFQADSETLVTGLIRAEEDQIDNPERFNLGRYSDVKGEYRSYEDIEYMTDDNWDHGYHRLRAGVAIPSSAYSSKVISSGKSVVFFNGVKMDILETFAGNNYTEIYFDADQILDYNSFGSLEHIRFLDADGNEIDHAVLSPYRSQYGLQGKVFKYIARFLKNYNVVEYLHLLCSFATAFVLMVLVFLIRKKYDHLLAGCFFVTFLLSPWIVNFARNLYWVEFTWFLPMAAGLFCAWKIEIKKARILSYAAVFVFVMIKSLCGYEYITTVMMGAIAFMLVDFSMAVVSQDKKRSILLFQTIFILGIAALTGFFAAICVHADLKGGGNILEGIKLIFSQDVLRRTYGADLNNFTGTYGAELYYYSLTASVWEVLSKYFHFDTEIITGIAGNLFPLLCIMPLLVFVCDYKVGRVNVKQISMYIVFFLTAASWYVLAKAHSYIHTRMNYVLWYVGFVPICFYVILNKVVVLYRGICGRGEKD